MELVRSVPYARKRDGVHGWIAAGVAAMGWWLAALAGLPVSADDDANASSGLAIFKDRVAGLLTANCVRCHGGAATKSEFDLTTREGMLQGGTLGQAIVPGKASESLLVKLVTHTDEPAMPYEAEKLPDQAIADLVAWIDLGAPYAAPLVDPADQAQWTATISDKDRQFWAFQPLANAAPPQVRHGEWCRTDVDRFILARLEEKGLAPNASADRRKLIRRLYFDLVGLPPSPQEIEAFVNDPAADAYAQLVDRLLASPHFGERWGRHWLDLARFAESHGYEQDYDRPSAYHFRDFVIRALNDDMPFDRFVRLQIAGDEIEPDNPLAMMATGYLAAGTHATQITANQAEKERYDELDDMVATIGTSMLGLTIGCARCHTHKFDPIPQRDYYAMLSTFTTTVRSDMNIDLHPEKFRAAKADFDLEHAPLAEALARFERDELPAKFDEWLTTSPQPPDPAWLVLEAESLKGPEGVAFARQADGSYLVSGTNPDSAVYTFQARTPLARITAIRVEALADPSLPKGGPGRADNGNFALSELEFAVGPGDSSAQPAAVKLASARASFSQDGLAVAAAIDGDKATAWAVDPQVAKDHAAAFDAAQPVELTSGTAISCTLKFDVNKGHGIGRLRIAVSTAAAPVGLEGEQAPHQLVVDVRRILALPGDQRTEADRSTLSQWFRTTLPPWRELAGRVEQHLKQAPRPEMTKVLISSEGVPAVRLHTQGPDFYEQTYFLKRGDLRQKQGEAPQGFLQVLMTAPEGPAHWQVPPPSGWRTSYKRNSLANWITDSRSGAGHLLARVIVNRLWQHHLGRGIVGTPSDFGAQGERPTHPELLDWLASRLIEGGWRLKPIHRLIVTSSVYMQTAEIDAARAAIDPNNLLHWRRSRRRLDAEVIRDALLAVSGSLDTTMFGPGSLDEGNHRRSIYLTIKRSQLIPMMMLFDAPEPNQGMGRRSCTTIAPQALALLNNEHIRGLSKAFAGRLAAAAASNADDALRAAYQIALGRLPSDEELAETRDFVQRQADSYRASNNAQPLETAYTDFCQALVSLNEFVYVE